MGGREKESGGGSSGKSKGTDTGENHCLRGKVSTVVPYDLRTCSTVSYVSPVAKISIFEHFKEEAKIIRGKSRE